MELRIDFEVNEEENISYKIFPKHTTHDNSIIFSVQPNQSIDIFISVTKRIGYSSNIKIKRIVYEDYDLENFDKFCTLFKDGCALKTHGYIDGGVYRIRIRSNPISQHFIEYLLDLAK